MTRKCLAATSAMLATWGMLSILGLGCGGPSAEPSIGPLLVASASSLQEALPEAARAFEADGGGTVALSFGSSGQLASQIEHGAPFDLFLAADRSFVDRLAEIGDVDPTTARDYARGRLVLVSRSDLEAPIAAMADLARDDVRAVAIAEPEFAPYGRAARQVLEAAGLWETIAPKLVRGRSVRQALQYAQSGDADAALVAESLALAAGLPSVAVDPALHEPLHQRLAVTSSSSRPDLAAAFASFLIDGPGRDILARHGFLPPEGDPAMGQ